MLAVVGMVVGELAALSLGSTGSIDQERSEAPRESRVSDRPKSQAEADRTNEYIQKRMEEQRAFAEKRIRELEALQRTPLAQAVLSEYPKMRTPSPIAGAPPRDGIVVRRIEKPPGSKCSTVTLWRREYLLRGEKAGGTGPVVEELWGVLPDGSLRKMGQRTTGVFEISGYYDLDAQLVGGYIERCVKTHKRKAVADLFFELSMRPAPAFGIKHDPPLIVEMQKVLDLPKEMPPKTKECFLAMRDPITEILSLPSSEVTNHGIVERRCVLFTSVYPLWSIADLVCTGLVFSPEAKLLHAEILFQQRCGSVFGN